MQRQAESRIRRQGENATAKNGGNKMKRVCGWCGLVMEDGTGPETTGICRPCLKTAQEELKRVHPQPRTGRGEEQSAMRPMGMDAGEDAMTGADGSVYPERA